MLRGKKIALGGLVLAGVGLCAGLLVSSRSHSRHPVSIASFSKKPVVTEILDQASSVSEPQNASSELKIAATELSQRRAFGRWLDKNLLAVDASPDLNERVQGLHAIASQLGLSDIPATLALLKESKPHSSGAELASLLLNRWATNNPAASARWISQNLNGSLRLEALNGVARAWSASDSVAAIEWVKHLETPAERTSVLTTLVYEVARTDPAGASVLVPEMPTGNSREEMAARVAAEWTATSPAKALAWATGMPDENVRDRAVAAIATTLADIDPISAGTIAIQSLPPGKTQNDAVLSVVQTWVQSEPEKAANWVAAFPEGLLRDTALEAVVKLWADQDLTTVGAWVTTIAGTSGADNAVAAYAQKLALEFPETAARWIQEIKSDTLREQQMENLGELWLRNDATAAKAWLASSSLSDAVKSRLRGSPVE